MPVSAARTAWVSEILLSTDSDRFEVYKVRQGFSPGFHTWSDHWRIAVQRSLYREGAWRANGEQIAGAYRRLAPDGTGIEAQVSVNQVAGHQQLTADGRWALKVMQHSTAEFLVARDLVESRLGLLSGRRYWLAGLSLETQWNERWSTVTYLAQTHFSDDNVRQTIKGKLVYDLVPSYGITSQLWYQNQRNSQLDASAGAYFNPARYEETLLVLALRKRFTQWMVRARIGAGTQQVTAVGPSRAQFADLILEPSHPGPWYFRTVLGYKLSAGVNDASYIYRYAMQELVIPF